MHLTATLKLKKLKEREALLKSEIDTLNTKLRHETSTLITSLLDHYDLLTIPQNTLLGALDETLEALSNSPHVSQKFDLRGNKVRQRLKSSKSNERRKNTTPLAEGEVVLKDIENSTSARPISSKRPEADGGLLLPSSKVSTQPASKRATSHA